MAKIELKQCPFCGTEIDDIMQNSRFQLYFGEIQKMNGARQLIWGQMIARSQRELARRMPR